MSGMSSILGISPCRLRLLLQPAGIEGEKLQEESSGPSGSPLSFWLVARGIVLVERDPQYAAHFAHAYNPSLLDASLAR